MPGEFVEPVPFMQRAVYGGVNQAVAALIPSGATRVLDLGCGDGSFGKWLKSNGVSSVTGVTVQGTEAELARRVLDEVIEADLDRWEPAEEQVFDGIVASHVLEHLSEPDRLLRVLQARVKPGGWLVAALPNALFWRQRLAFLAGNFRYTQGGIMDSTHLRFFDWTTAHALLTGNGWQPECAVADGSLPGSRWTGPLRPILNRWACRAFPGLFGFQFVFQARLPTRSPPVSGHQTS